VPSTTFLEIAPAEQAQMRAVLRRMRHDYLLAFHIFLLGAAGLFGARSRVYRMVQSDRIRQKVLPSL